jgi:putative flippase GtrA
LRRYQNLNSIKKMTSTSKERVASKINSSKHQQFIKYFSGGTLYFWVAYGVFALCYSGLHWNWLPAKILSDAIGWSLNYFVQRFWAFSEQHHLSEMQHAGRYIFIESIGFVMDYALIGGLKWCGITPYIGFFISGAFFTVWSWLWYRYWVFPENKKVA